MMKTNDLFKYLDYYIPDVRCELDYSRDYELLIATVLSAQCTDKRVNIVTKELFSKYNLYTLASANVRDIENIIRSCGSFVKKSNYLKNIAQSLVRDFNGIVPNDREYLEKLPGVGRKTCNVVLKNLFGVPCIPVDTHVIRVTNRLGIANDNDDPETIEAKLMNMIPVDKWNQVGEQILLFGRYYCTSRKPKCDNCLFKKYCKNNNDD